jgi:hypothetical protein
MNEAANFKLNATSNVLFQRNVDAKAFLQPETK